VFDFFFLEGSSKSGSARPKSRHRERAHTGAPQEEAGEKSLPCFFLLGSRADASFQSETVSAKRREKICRGSWLLGSTEAATPVCAE
jgi:hypothetical protein